MMLFSQLAMIVIPAAFFGLVCAALVVRHMRRDPGITIERGEPRPIRHAIPNDGTTGRLEMGW